MTDSFYIDLPEYFGCWQTFARLVFTCCLLVSHWTWGANNLLASVILIILTSCSCRVLWRYFQTGNWVYPVFASLNPLGIVIFFSVTYILSAIIYLLGEKINHWKWGQCFPLIYSPHRHFFLIHALPSTQTKGKLNPNQKTTLLGAFVHRVQWVLWTLEEKKPCASWHSLGDSMCLLLPSNNILFNSKTDSSFETLGPKEQGVITPAMRGKIL